MDIKLLKENGDVITIIRNVRQPHAKFESIWKDQFDAHEWVPHVVKESLESKLEKIRIRRDMLLTKSDWTQIPDAQLTTEQADAWKVYRQSLRDLPSTIDADNPVFPVDPLGNT